MMKALKRIGGGGGKCLLYDWKSPLATAVKKKTSKRGFEWIGKHEIIFLGGY